MRKIGPTHFLTQKQVKLILYKIYFFKFNYLTFNNIQFKYDFFTFFPVFYDLIFCIQKISNKPSIMY